MSKSYSDYETALIYVKYWKMVLTEKDKFNPRDKDMITVRDVMVSKFGENSREFKDCDGPFEAIDIWDTYLGELDYETFMKHANFLLNRPVMLGGSRTSPDARKTLPKPMTVLRKFAYLSSAINHMIKQGADIENHTQRVIAHLRELDRKTKRNAE